MSNWLLYGYVIPGVISFLLVLWTFNWDVKYSWVDAAIAAIPVINIMVAIIGLMLMWDHYVWKTWRGKKK